MTFVILLIVIGIYLDQARTVAPDMTPFWAYVNRLVSLLILVALASLITWVME